MPKCNCAGNACNCNIVAGDGMVVTGTGNASSPFQISLASQLIPITVTVAGPIDLSAMSSGAVAFISMSANVTGLTLPSSAGARIDIVLLHVTVPTTLTWPSGIAWAGGSAPVQSSTAGRYDWFRLRNLGSIWIGEAAVLNAF